ncbi:hypothetical protein DHEL01_v206738 [Diaporthe helianthi]|uniref:Major facilitator superfamily transporter n=1 Tax=Diaporthe helianthi TaxID=158607 RepID=A0A2P5HX78_DIAHE|nr:hypothetical protein DHEL01_v206738 [Diaporthe helianthi]
MDILLEHCGIHNWLHHLCRCAQLGCPHIRKSLSRLLDGWGFTGGLVIAGYVVSKQKVPLFISFISTMFMVASIVGPVLGGVSSKAA